MQITATFESIEDMKDFAGLVLAGEKAVTEPIKTAQQVVPAPQTAPVQTAPAIPPVAPPQAQPITHPSVAPVPTPVQTVSAVAPPAAPPQMTAPAPAAPVPTNAKTYTPDDLARAAMALMDSGRQADLIGLLQQFGVSSIPELAADQYGAFATALRGMGAQI